MSCKLVTKQTQTGSEILTNPWIFLPKSTKTCERIETSILYQNESIRIVNWTALVVFTTVQAL